MPQRRPSWTSLQPCRPYLAAIRSADSLDGIVSTPPFTFRACPFGSTQPWTRRRSIERFQTAEPAHVPCPPSHRQHHSDDSARAIRLTAPCCRGLLPLLTRSPFWPQSNRPSWMRQERSRPAARRTLFRALRFTDSSPQASCGPSP